jgi:hypothetical protein
MRHVERAAGEVTLRLIFQCGKEQQKACLNVMEILLQSIE